MTTRPRALASILSLAAFAACAPAAPPLAAGALTPDEAPPSASYTVTVRAVTPVPRFAVRAELWRIGDTLRMEQTRPGDSPEILRRGWPAVIQNLRVRDARGQEIAAMSAGAAGWVLGPHGEHVVVEYDSDLALLAGQGWPAPREAAFADDSGVLVVARALFVGDPAAGEARVRFVVPPGWRVAAPWLADPRDAGLYRVRGFDHLTTNAFALTRAPASAVSAGGFSLEAVTFGRWRRRGADATAVLCASAAAFTELFGEQAPHRYLAAFLDDADMAGEAYLDSYVMQADPELPAGRWGRIVAHELFHFWNGQRLRGRDYVASQWFQEGVTEYQALLATTRNGFMSQSELLAQLGERLTASRGMTASLAESGARKNAAFYGRATVTAMLLDLLLRERTGGARSLDDLLRSLWRDFEARPYTLPDLYAAASRLGGPGVGDFLVIQVEGAAPAEPDALLATVGLRVSRPSGGPEHVTVDPSAPAAARTRWSAMLAPRPAARGCPRAGAG